MYALSNKGAIAFLGSSGPGTEAELDEFTTYLHKNIGSVLYGQSVGKCIQAGFKSIMQVTGTGDEYMNAVCLEMTLDGDPSVIVHSSKLPDYAVTTSSVYFTPSYVSTDLDSFNVNIIIDNIGKATNSKVKTYIKRYFADGTYVTYSKTLPHIYYKETLSIRIPG